MAGRPGAWAVLVFDDLTKRFPRRLRPAIEGIDLEVHDGEILGLVGLNGAGKTTTIRVAAGVSLPSSGRVLIDGCDVVREKRRASARVGWVPEGFPYDVNARALTLLEYLAGFHGISGRAGRARCRESLAQVGLSAVERARIRTFSLGMKRRFALASAMVADPPNLLLDEVLNGLDPEGTAFARAWLLSERKAGRALLLSSHHLGELQAIADRIAFVHEGVLLQTIRRSELAHGARTVLRLTVENLDDAALDYLRTVGTPRVEASTIRLEEARIRAADLNAELVRRGYRIAELREEAPSLETYFLDLIGAAQ